jgi:hypothetical protein
MRSFYDFEEVAAIEAFVVMHGSCHVATIRVHKSNYFYVEIVHSLSWVYKADRYTAQHKTGESLQKALHGLTIGEVVLDREREFHTHLELAGYNVLRII